MTPTNIGSHSPNPSSAAAKFFKQNSPVWYGSSPASRPVSESEGNRYDESFEASRMEEDEVLEEEDSRMEILKARGRKCNYFR